jgi:hypothetical protein
MFERMLYYGAYIHGSDYQEARLLGTKLLDGAQIVLYKLCNGYKILGRQIIQQKERQQVLRPNRRNVCEGY